MALALLCDRFERRTEDDELIEFDEKSARRQVADIGGVLRPFVSADSSGLGIEGYAADTPEYLRRLNEIVQGRRHGVDAFTGCTDQHPDLALGARAR